MSDKFKNVQELSAYLDELRETVYNRENRMELRSKAIAANISVFSEYRRMKAKMRHSGYRGLNNKDIYLIKKL